MVHSLAIRVTIEIITIVEQRAPLDISTLTGGAVVVVTGKATQTYIATIVTGYRHAWSATLGRRGVRGAVQGVGTRTGGVISEVAAEVA